MAASLSNSRAGIGLARRPLVDEVRDAITAELILSKAVLPGQRLPTEAELCDRYGVSRITVRSALRSLRETGYITVRQGFGSTVAPRPDIITSGIDQLCSFETYAAKQGHQVTSAELEIEEVRLSEREAQHFDLPSGSRALAVRRTKLYGDVTVGWIVDYVPAGVIDFQTLTGEFAGSVLDVLLDHPEIGVDYSDCDLVPVCLTGSLAAKLKVRRGTPALQFDEITRTASGRAVNWCQAWLLAEHFKFQVRRHR
jgi:GntR family transcriptional regulator